MKMKTPTGRVKDGNGGYKDPAPGQPALHRGHQCTQCSGYYHNICTSASSTNNCGRHASGLASSSSEGSYTQLDAATTKSKSPPQNTVRLGKKLKCAAGSRVRAIAATVNHLVEKESNLGYALAAIIQGKGGRSFVYGNVVRGNSAIGWDIRWDFGGADAEPICHPRANFDTIKTGEEEPADPAEGEEWEALPEESDKIQGVPGFDGKTYEDLRGMKKVKIWTAGSLVPSIPRHTSSGRSTRTRTGPSWATSPARLHNTQKSMPVLISAGTCWNSFSTTSFPPWWDTAAKWTSS